MIKSLTALRGIFILFIFLHHAGVYPGGGSMAVAFFFVLSGFGMTLGYKDRVLQPDFSYRRYLTRRFFKFYPLHWVTLIADIPLALMGTLHWWLIPVFFVNAALLHTLIPISDVFFSFNAVSWFLADILLFAVLFPFIYRCINNAVEKKREKRFIIVMGLLYVILVIALLFSIFILGISSKWWHPVLYISPYVRITDFMVGIFLALWFLRLKESSKYVKYQHASKFGLIIICALIFTLIAESIILPKQIQLLAPLYWPLVGLLIITASVSKPSDLHIMENKMLLWLGECSFVIFLVHRLVLRYTSKLLSINNKAIYIVFCLVLTLIMSYLIDKYLLNPISQWLTKKQPSMTARS